MFLSEQSEIQSEAMLKEACFLQEGKNIKFKLKHVMLLFRYTTMMLYDIKWHILY